VKSAIFSSLGKAAFIERYPFLFAFFVFTGVEIGLYLVGEHNLIERINDFPLRSIGMLLLKYVIMLMVTFSYLYLKQTQQLKRKN
jgi:hypothetical protein